MAEYRTVTVYAEQSIYRARVVEASKGLLRKKQGFRFVIERRWSKVSERLARQEDWRQVKRGPWTAERDYAEALATDWLDRAERRNPTEDSYVKRSHSDASVEAENRAPIDREQANG